MLPGELDNDNDKGTHLNETWVSTPAVNDTPLDVSHLARSPTSEEFIQAAPRRTATVLWVLCECYGTFHAVGSHPPGSLLGEWTCVTESDVRLVRSGLWMELVKQSAHSGALILGIAKDGGSSTYLAVLFFDLRRPSFGDDGYKNALEG